MTPSVHTHTQPLNVCSLAFRSQLSSCFTDRPPRRPHFSRYCRCSSWHNKHFALLWKYLNSSAFRPAGPTRAVVLVQRFCIPHGRHVLLHYKSEAPVLVHVDEQPGDSLASYVCKRVARHQWPAAPRKVWGSTQPVCLTVDLQLHPVAELQNWSR